MTQCRAVTCAARPLPGLASSLRSKLVCAREQSLGLWKNCKQQRTFQTAVLCQAAASSMSDTPVKDVMEKKLKAELDPVRLDLIDESHKHAGHAAMKGLNKQETHFNLAVVSESFEGLPKIKRHKLVYKVLSEELAGPVHALSLKTLTPAEAQ